MTKADFIEFIEGSQEWLRRFLASLCCGDMCLVDDLAQETYIKAFLSIESFKNEKRIKSWILKIAYNTFINYVRRKHPDVNIEEIVYLESEMNTDDTFKYENLYEALNSLPPKERASVILFYLEGYSSKEISVVLETKEANVRKSLSRGRERLRRLLK